MADAHRPSPCRFLERISLGWRFVIGTALTVSLVLGAYTFFQMYRTIERDRDSRRHLLDQFLGSLVEDVQGSRDLATAQARIDRFSQQVLNPMRSSIRLDLVDHADHVVASSDPMVLLRFGEVPENGVPYVHLPVFTPALGGEPGTLAVWIDAPSIAEEVRQRWRGWFTEMALLVATIVASLVIANHVLVTRPLHRLQEGVRQMGHGYLGVLKNVRGAPEWRFLGHEIWRLGSDLEQTVRRLVEAQRRAMYVPGPEGPSCVLPAATPEVVSSGPAETPVPPVPQPPPVPSDAARAGDDYVRRYLADKLRLLETQDPDDPEVQEHARVAWEQDVGMAERLGDMNLRSRLDNAALRVLNREAWDRLSRHFASMTDSPPAWLSLRESEIRAALQEANVTVLDLQRRAKHVAGIWRKMQALDIEADQVQDVFGFRVIVPGTEDCYRALEALHRHFEPQLLSFKDYIARPKANGYRSLHTHVRAVDGPVFEVQIRTAQMHVEADGPDGDAAHWRYKRTGRGRPAVPAIGRGLLGRLFGRRPADSSP